MRRLGWWLTVLVMLASGLWFLAAWGLRSAIEQQLQALSTDGWEVGYDRVGTSGYPLRMTAEVSAVRMFEPGLQLGWQGTSLALGAPVWNPTRLTLTLPPEQRLDLPGTDVTIVSDRLDAVVETRFARNLALEFAGIDAVSLNITAAGTVVGAEGVSGMVQAAADGTANYSVNVEALGVTLPDAVRLVIDPEDTLPTAMEGVRLRGLMMLDRPIELAGSEAIDGIETLIIEDLGLTWGALSLRVDGVLRPDPETGLAESDGLQLAIRDYPAMLDLVVAAGLIAPDERASIAGAFAAVADQDGDDDPRSVSIALAMRAGQIRVGPLAVGPIIRLR